MKRRTFRRLAQTEAARDHHYVYVVLLDGKAAALPSVKRLNRGRHRKIRECVYVGMTGLRPEERFANHKNGVKAASVVTKYGIRLLPELYEHLNPMPFDAALQMEMDLAEDLRSAGYIVAGGH